jgi:flagellar basal body-associated protein FliL
MDDIRPTQPIVETMPAAAPVDIQKEAERRHKRKIVISGIVVVVVIAVIVGAVFYFLKPKSASTATPEEALQALDASSAPVTSTTQERATDLSKAQQDSYITPGITPDQRKNTLNALK